MENSEQDTPGNNVSEKLWKKKDTNTDTIKNMNNSQYLDCGGGEIWNIRINIYLNIERKLQIKDKFANTDTRKYNYKQKQNHSI